jgi:hypothetical protein
MPPKDFFQPKTMLENQMVQAQGLTSIPMGSAMMNQMVQAQGLTSITMGSAMMNQSSASIPMGSTMMNQMVKAQGLTSIPMGSAMMNQSSTSPFGERNMISDALGKNLDSDNSFMFSNNTRDPKTNLAVSPTNPKLQMQEEPKEKNKDKEASKQTEDISKSFGTLKEQLNEFSEIIKSTGETLEKTFKDKSQDKSQQQNQQKDKQVEEVKFNEIKANVTVNSTPDTKTEAAIAAIEKVINELRSQMDQLKSKVTNQVNPPSVKRN